MAHDDGSLTLRDLQPGERFRWHDGQHVWEYRGNGWFSSPEGGDGGPWHEEHNPVVERVALMQLAADVRYIDGPLSGLVIRNGYRITGPAESINRAARWVATVRAAGDFVRAVGTGHRYTFTTAPRVEVLP